MQEKLCPRSEHPRPDAARENILILNGEWEFEIDNAKVGKEKNFFERTSLEGRILVPFCPESRLSGIGHTDFMQAVWYRRSVTLPKEYDGKRIFLHIGAADYETEVYINGQYAGRHKGGYTPFAVEMTPFLKQGEQVITVYCQDDTRSPLTPTGKQAVLLRSSGCCYTRTTGIWQTVWVEAVEEGYISSFRLYPDIHTPSLTALVRTKDAIGQTLTLTASFEGRVVGQGTVQVASEETPITLALSEKHLWQVGDGQLYDLTLQLSGGDKMESYFGLREVSWKKDGLRINGKRVFGRFVLDQGFYPDGIYTAPTDERLEKDILDSLTLGFNGARPHEKVFEPRYLYYADKHGYLIFGEYPNWGLDVSTYDTMAAVLPEWLEEMERDFNHPALIGWCPYNETWDYDGRHQRDELLSHIYRLTKAIDTTRPCIDTSGNFHVETDIFDIHHYDQQKEGLKVGIEKINEPVSGDGRDFIKARQHYDGKLPFFVSEYGGILWDMEKQGEAWGYGSAVKTEEEFLTRYKDLTDTLLDAPWVTAFCYTQLYDVEQEKNGLMTYDRRFKFDPAVIHAINSRKAAIEKDED